MTKTIKPAEAFKGNATTDTALDAEVVARYCPQGPNKWDDYALCRIDAPEKISVDKGSHIHVEPIGADPEVRFRLRKGRDVLVLRWCPNEEDDKEIKSGRWGVQEAENASWAEEVLGLAPKNDPRDDMLEYFLATKAEK